MEVSSAFEAEGYSNEIRIRDKGTVKSAFIKFKGLLAELGISRREDQILSVRVEVDTNPPEGAITTTTVIRKFVTLNLLHYDRPSLLAGKLHAVLSRAYVRGRDLFALVWYLTDRTWPEPNFTFLNNALAQTRWAGPKLIAANWRRIVMKRMEDIH